MRRHLIKHLAKIFDLFALIASFIAAVAVVSWPTGITVTGFLALRIKVGNCLLFVVLIVGWHSLLSLCGLYFSKRLTTRRTQLVEVCRATLAAIILLFVSAAVFHIAIVNSLFLFVFWLSSTSLMVMGRFGARPLLFMLRSRGRNRRFILIVGTNERAVEFAGHIARNPELGYEIVGFVDNDWPGIQGFDAAGLARCCTFESLAEFLRHNVIDEAAIYLPLRSYYEHAADLVSLCEHHGIVIRFDSQVFKMRIRHSRLEDDNSQILAVGALSDILPSIIKRTLDCVCSGVLLAILSPLFVLVAALIKLFSPGPILFSQTRVGLNKRHFQMFKFRTMVVNAEQLQDQLLGMNEMSGPAFKISKDPRVTALGKFLRKSSIDELPQLFNVLKGEMSLVGPRAMSLRDYQLFEQDWQRRRFSVKPGITCLWQIHGRNSVPFERWMELDMQYIDKWSLWLDIKILVQTVPAVLRGTGAA
jgi:exopolysaccharide biosynthesis polyprenyl glycosylphosphotransferase